MILNLPKWSDLGTTQKVGFIGLTMFSVSAVYSIAFLPAIWEFNAFFGAASLLVAGTLILVGGAVMFGAVFYLFFCSFRDSFFR